MVVHHLEYSRSTRILWLLEELGQSFELQVHKRDRNFRAPRELRDLHPLGKAPLVAVDGVVFAESGAIIEELLERFDDGTLRPEDADGRRLFRYWLHFAEGSLMAPLLVRLITSQLHGPKVPFLVRPVGRAVSKQIDAAYTTAELERLFAFVEAHLGEHAYFAGEQFSAADIQMSYGIEAGLERAGLSFPTPNLRAWLERVRSRPAYDKAIALGGPVAPADGH
ncbi:MAG: glutathione S-transferase [Proteobacteria bacterium]|nr:glutathione S-transferase [Pseudomonadota bacterium]